MADIDYSPVGGLLGNLPQDDERNLLDYLRKVKAELNGGGSYNNGLLSGGGRVGVNFPVGDATGRVGASGWGAYGDGIKEYGINRLDAGINKDNIDVGVDFDPNDALHNWMLRMKYGF